MAVWNPIGLRPPGTSKLGKIMEDPERCRAFLEQILHIKIHHVVILDKQKTIDEKIDARGVRLDIYVDDGNTIYNCEMQAKVLRCLGKRSRYYQSQIDMRCLKKGQDYSELKRSYVIFICTFDPFEKGRFIYTFKNTCVEDPDASLDDETYKVFINTKGTIGNVSDDFRELMHFLDTSEIKEYHNPLVNDLADALQKARTMEEWRQDYMSIEMLKRDAKEEGREEGREEGETNWQIRFKKLTEVLSAKAKFNDILKTATEPEYAKKLMAEYGI